MEPHLEREKAWGQILVDLMSVCTPNPAAHLHFITGRAMVDLP
jgi:hypothetical protein